MKKNIVLTIAIAAFLFVAYVALLANSKANTIINFINAQIEQNR